MKTKEEIDAAAHQAGFPDSDYPFYSPCNGCGPDGWKGKLVPDKSHLWEGANFTASCNQHDRDYMTLGRTREEADRAFRENLRAAVESYLNATVEQTINRLVKRTVIERVPRQVVKKVKERVKKRVKDALKPWKWIDIWVDEIRDVVETVYDEVPREVEEIVKEVQTVRRALLLTPANVAEMEALPEVYYQAVRCAGQKYYDDSQAKQAAYESWIHSYLESDVRAFA